MGEWLNQTWVIVAAVIGGISLVWTFINKTMKEISAAINKPFKELDAKIDNLDKKIDTAKGADELIKNTLLSMQRQSLLRACEEYLKHGYASMEQKETIAKQYQTYHDLGGDSFITDMVEQVKDLPLSKPQRTKKSKSTE